jgi:hypothetical protein
MVLEGEKGDPLSFETTMTPLKSRLISYVILGKLKIQIEIGVQ